MSLISRVVYLAILLAAAAIYVAMMPPESLSMASIVHYMIPATSIGLLFLLANGVMGAGVSTHIGAIVLVIAVMTLVSVSLTSTGLVAHVKEAVDLASNMTNATNTSLLSIWP